MHTVPCTCTCTCTLEYYICDETIGAFVYFQDFSDTIQLLGRDNIDEGRLWDYAIEAAAWSTELPKLDFAVSYMKILYNCARDRLSLFFMACNQIHLYTHT